MAEPPNRPAGDLHDARLAARLSGLAGILKVWRQNRRYIGYRQAEQDCERLAAQLLALYSPEALARFACVAIPRGGLIVLGMLAYALDLQPARLQGAPDPAAPLLVVDDCALSGARFAQVMRKTANAQVVFAHLYSHPALRQAIRAQEPRVQHCLAAHDLVDRRDLVFAEPEDEAVWHRCWQERLGSERYWIGRPDPIAFAWSEPDRPLWNPVTERIENGWRFTPPHRCLKNKTRLGLPPQPVSSRTWQVPAAVVSGQFDGLLWLCHTETEQVYTFDPIGAAMWRAMAGYGDWDAAVVYLRSTFAVDEITVRRDLQHFVATLATKGLLEPAKTVT